MNATAQTQADADSLTLCTAQNILIIMLETWHSIKDQREESSLIAWRYEQRARIRQRLNGDSHNNASCHCDDSEHASRWRDQVQHLDAETEVIEGILRSIHLQYPVLGVLDMLVPETNGWIS